MQHWNIFLLHCTVASCLFDAPAGWGYYPSQYHIRTNSSKTRCAYIKTWHKMKWISSLRIIHVLLLCLPAVTRTETPKRDRPAESVPVPQRQKGVAPLRLCGTRPLGESLCASATCKAACVIFPRYKCSVSQRTFTGNGPCTEEVSWCSGQSFEKCDRTWISTILFCAN